MSLKRRRKQEKKIHDVRVFFLLQTTFFSRLAPNPAFIAYPKRNVEKRLYIICLVAFLNKERVRGESKERTSEMSARKGASGKMVPIKKIRRIDLFETKVYIFARIGPKVRFQRIGLFKE